MLMPQTNNFVSWLIGVWPNDPLSELWLGMTAFAVLFLIVTLWWDAIDCQQPRRRQILDALDLNIVSAGVNLPRRVLSNMSSASEAESWRNVSNKWVGIAAAAVVATIAVWPAGSMNHGMWPWHHWWHSEFAHHNGFRHGCGRHMNIGCSITQSLGFSIIGRNTFDQRLG
jgi:hypothetical protein